MDTSSYYSYSTLTAYTDFFPIISLEENNTQTSLIEGVRLSKYSLSTNSLYTLSVTVNTYNTAPYNVLYPTIYLQNEQAESMQIQIRLQILGDTTTGNFNSASCIPCDADFGQDCPVFLESGGQKLYSFPDGDGIYAPREQGNFGGVETGVTRITQEILQASGASQLLLAAHDTRISHQNSLALAARLHGLGPVIVVPGTNHKTLLRSTSTQTAMAAYLNGP